METNLPDEPVKRQNRTASGAVVAGAAITWVIVKPVLCDGGAQTRGPC